MSSNCCNLVTVTTSLRHEMRICVMSNHLIVMNCLFELAVSDSYLEEFH